MKKCYITANQLLEDSFALGVKVLESDYLPTFIIGVWRGGAPIGIAVQEVLDVCGVTTNHISVRTSSYGGIDKRSKQVIVHGLSWAIESLTNNDRFLIVDDVHDSGLSVDELVRQINLRCGGNAPENIKIATVYYKEKKSKVDYAPDFYLHQTNDWLVFPHELQGLSETELTQHKPGLKKIKKALLERMAQ